MIVLSAANLSFIEMYDSGISRLHSDLYYEKGGMFSIIRDFLDFRTLLRAKNVLVKKHFRETDRERNHVDITLSKYYQTSSTWECFA